MTSWGGGTADCAWVAKTARVARAVVSFMARLAAEGLVFDLLAFMIGSVAYIYLMEKGSFLSR